MRERWDKRKVVAQIHERHRVGLRLNAHAIQKEDSKLNNAAVTHFGSWKKSIKAAGLDYRRIRCKRQSWRTMWSKEKIIAKILERQTNGLRINGAAVYQEDLGLYRAAQKWFGRKGYGRALRKAGINPHDINPLTIWTKKKLIWTILDLCERNIPLDSTNLCSIGQRTVITGGAYLFGSWPNAIKAAGLDYEKVRRLKSWSKRKVVKAVRRLADQGLKLNSEFMKRYDCSLWGVGKFYFGSWKNCLQAAGFDYRQHCKNWEWKLWLQSLPYRKAEALHKSAMKLAEERRKA